MTVNGYSYIRKAALLVHIFTMTPPPPTPQDKSSTDRGYNHEAVEKVDRDAVGALVVGSPDLSDASVGRDDEHGGEVAL